MKTRSAHLPVVLDIPAPCPEPWEKMSGDGRERHCARCSTQIHNLSVLSDHEIVELTAREHLCVSMQLSADGALARADSVAPLRSQAARVVVAAALTALSGCSEPQRQPLVGKVDVHHPALDLPGAAPSSAGGAPSSSLGPPLASSATAPAAPSATASMPPAQPSKSPPALQRKVGMVHRSTDENK